MDLVINKQAAEINNTEDSSQSTAPQRSLQSVVSYK